MKKEVLVIIPHSSRKRPIEIKKAWLSRNQRSLLYSGPSETDRCSQKLYDLREFLNNKQVLFPISQVYVNVCRHPDKLDDVCPLEIRGKQVYNRDISEEFRKKLVKRYAFPFYKKIEHFKGNLILNGHTTITNHSSLNQQLKHQIVISNIQIKGNKVRKFAPDKLIKIYVEELRNRLSGIKIGVNSVYVNVYDHFCDKFGWKKNKGGIPIIHQETDESLYIKGNKLDVRKLNKIRKAIAESLAETSRRCGVEK
ncbi:MAG: N-formylglutamate amidohydrolase [archaeon]|nr:N-formylglutamate amidohydrolase [archaeon]